MLETPTLNPQVHVHQAITAQEGHLYQPSMSHPKATSQGRLTFFHESVPLELIRRYLPQSQVEYNLLLVVIFSRHLRLVSIETASGCILSCECVTRKAWWKHAWGGCSNECHSVMVMQTNISISINCFSCMALSNEGTSRPCYSNTVFACFQTNRAERCTNCTEKNFCDEMGLEFPKPCLTGHYCPPNSIKPTACPPVSIIVGRF